MGTDSLTVEQIANAQAKENEGLRAKLQRLEERLGPDPEAAVKPDGFPKVVYQKQAKPDPTQIDHPGWDAKRVETPQALETALADGWVAVPGAFVYPDPDVETIIVKTGKRGK